jgi:hypothetical protein
VPVLAVAVFILGGKMSLRIPVILEFSNEALALLRASATSESRPEPQDIHVAPPTESAVELPDAWQLVEEREGESYSWPQGDDEYVTFRIYEGQTSAGAVRLAIGRCARVAARGKDRHYLMTHYLTPRGSKRPISEFLETDNYDETREVIAIIKGKGGGAKMYDPSDELPAPYAKIRTETYRDRVDVPGSYEKLGVVAHEDDIATILGHSLIQSQTRFGLGPYAP